MLERFFLLAFVFIAGVFIGYPLGERNGAAECGPVTVIEKSDRGMR